MLYQILQLNSIILDDGVCEHPAFTQTTGYAQGDNISPILFTTLLSDLPELLRNKHPTVKIILYADDAVLFSRIRRDLQCALHTLEEYSRDNGLTVNTTKTKAMKFRRGGRPRSTEGFHLLSERLEYVERFCYLGVELTSRGVSFGHHISKRVQAAHSATCVIPNLHRLSLKSALSVFNIYVASVASYGLTRVQRYLLTLEYVW